jgi:hypothetical protein
MSAGEPNELGYATAPPRSRLHPVLAAIFAHIASSYLSTLAFTVADYVFRPDTRARQQPLAVMARLFAVSPIRVPLLPGFVLWRELRDPSRHMEPVWLGWLIAYIVSLPLMYCLFRRLARPRHNSEGRG